MFDFDSFIQNIVLENRRVIVPELGAFIHKEGSSPQLGIIFSTFLKYNDGFLEKKLSEQAKISDQEASGMIREFTSRVNQALSISSEFEVKGFGRFFIDSQRTIQFVFEPVEQSVPITPITPVIHLPPVVPPVSGNNNSDSSSIENKSDNGDLFVSKTTYDNNFGSHLGNNDQNKNNLKNNKEDNIVNDNIQPSPSPRPTPSAQTIRPTKKKRWILYSLLGALFLLILVGGCIYWYWYPQSATEQRAEILFPAQTPNNTSINVTENGQIQKQQESKEQEDLSKQEVDKQGSEMQAPKEVAQVKTSSSTANPILGPTYHVIVGCFSEKINAARFVEKCKENGFKDAEILSRLGDLYPVSLMRFSDKMEAERQTHDYNSKNDEEAWVYRTY